LPDAAALLAALVTIIDVPEMTISSSGLREGLLYQALEADAQAQDPLIVAAEFEGRRLARFAPHGRAVADWIAPLFAHEGAADNRLRLAASLLSDVAWSANPDFRAERGTEIGLHGNWRGIDIPGRILLARALHAGFGGADADFPAMGTLVATDRLARARQWGLAIRLAQRLTGGVEAPLKGSAITREGDRLILRLHPGWHHLTGESVERRLRSLAQALEAKPELVLL
jgi:exopolyphosphatase/guanosine-5'-triphosphate,3'-diphosphate pyrophosphatase